jgi:hypothetical protein
VPPIYEPSGLLYTWPLGVVYRVVGIVFRLPAEPLGFLERELGPPPTQREGAESLPILT